MYAVVCNAVSSAGHVGVDRLRPEVGWSGRAGVICGYSGRLPPQNVFDKDQSELLFWNYNHVMDMFFTSLEPMRFYLDAKSAHWTVDPSKRVLLINYSIKPHYSPSPPPSVE